MEQVNADRSPGRVPSGAVLVGIVAVYLVIVGVIHAVATSSLGELDYGRFPDVETIVRAVVIPVGSSIVFCVAVIGWLGWWTPVRGGDAPVERWVRVVPAVLLAAIVLGTDYATLADQGVGFTLVLLVAGLMIGLGEELMFRGIVIVALRRQGRVEGRVALVSSVVFGLAHAVNFFLDGGGNLGQIVVTGFMGWFLYVTRRSFGSVFVPAALHGLWDFGLFSGLVTTDVYGGAALFVLAELGVAILLIVRRRRIEITS